MQERIILITLLFTASTIQLFFNIIPKKKYEQLELIKLTEMNPAHSQTVYYKNNDAPGNLDSIPRPSLNKVQNNKPLDVNKLDSLAWISLGFKKFVVSNILKYQNKGGRFKDHQDLKKIYGINQRLVENYNSRFIFSISKGKKSNKELININLADSTTLSQLYGIGPVLSARIIKYRNSLGGFNNVRQLLEVYGLSQEVFDKNPDRIICQGDLSKININDADYSQLSAHFYFNHKIIKLLLSYREQHGRFTHLDDLKKIHTLNDSIYEKIKPYCSIN